MTDPGPAVASVDGFDEAAAAKLWALLPAIYRQLDNAVLDGTGPLQALLDRAATQVGVVRRSIERLWEDQSIETCSDWVIPYIAALVDTNLVPSMDARGQRLDVANTIYYRRRKGTMALLEQLAADVTGWECHIVEFFRALGRSRHLLDPPIGRPADDADPPGARRLQRASRLAGLLTGTPAGGWADLRNALGAANADGPWDEFSHRADVRIGRRALGWYGIPKIGVFLWRSADIAVDRATPVLVAGCPDHYAVDPTGRQIGLWQADDRPPEGYGERWTPLAQWQVPGSLTKRLYDAVLAGHRRPPPVNGYPDPSAQFQPGSFAARPVGSPDPLDETTVRLWPEVGRFAVPTGTGDVEVTYHYGLFSRIGAGPYDRRQLGTPVADDPAPVTLVPGGSPSELASALAALGPTGTVVVTDGLTSTGIAPVGSAAAPIDTVTVRAADEGRAVIRVDASEPWIFTGSAPDAEPTARLRLEGLLYSGSDIVLRGGFAEVSLSCCTLDPGTIGTKYTPPVLQVQAAVDGRLLTPTRLWIEGTVKTLIVDRCIAGPIRVRAGGVVQTLCGSDSVIQCLLLFVGPLTPDAVFDPDGLFRLLRNKRDPLTAWLAGGLGPPAANAVSAHADGAAVADADLAAVVSDLNTIMATPIWDPARFAGRPVPDDLVNQAEAGPTGADLVAVNRALLEAAFPVLLGQGALAFDEGTVRLCRCTVLGQGKVHALECSESVLDAVFVADDTQDGCVRFSAWATGSTLPRRYECVEIPQLAPLFVTRRFGEAGYAQLTEGVDATIVSSTTAGPPSIRTGSQAGSEMGVFCRDGAAVKERSLLMKYQEFLPVGLTPVIIPIPPSGSGDETMRGRPWPPT